MAIGDLEKVEHPSASDIYYVDTGMYGIAEYGAVYVLDTPEPAVIDTGIGKDVEHTLAGLAAVGIDREELSYIVPTHVHLDHAGGAGFLADACPEATVLCPEVGVPHLVDPSRLWAGTKRAVGERIEFYREPKPVPDDRIEALAGGDTIDLGDRTLDVYDAPGHAPHQAVFHSPADDAVFVADAAGIYAQRPDSVRPTSPPSNFDLEQCLEDVETIRGLDPELLLYGHYGPTETGEKLTVYETVLREWVEEIAAERERLDSDEAVVETVASRVPVVEPWTERAVYTEAAMNVRGVLGYLDAREE